MTTAREHTERTPMTDTTPEAPDFAALLLALDKGRVHTELSEAMRTVVAAVVATRKAGVVTLTINLKPQAGTDAYVVTNKITTKVPDYDRNATLFFVDGESNLVRNPSNQHDLFEESK